MSEPHHSPLGVMTPDSARTILVISNDGELGVAIRDRVDRAYALVKDVRPEEALAGIETCLPWPWLVIGNVPQLPTAVLDSLRNRPILVFWRGIAPPGLPSHARSFDRYPDLSEALTTCMNQSVMGMKLAIGLGVDLPDGSYARSAELQALVTNYPHFFDVPLDAFRSATRVLSAHGIPCRPVRDGESGSVSLVEAAGAAS